MAEDKDKTPLAIVGVSAENFQRVELVNLKLTPTGLTVILGKNAAGKSSLLNAIMDALGAKSKDATAQVTEPIHEGAKASTVRLELAPIDRPGEVEFIVTRRHTRSGDSLKVTNAKNAEFSKPQNMLDRFWGAHVGACDPLDVIRLRPADQVTTLLKLVEYPDVSADLAKLEIAPGEGENLLDALAAARKSTFEYRTQVNRDVDRLGKARGEMHLPQGHASLKPVDVADLLARQKALLDAQQARQAKFNEAQRAKTTAADMDGKALRYADRIAELREQLVKAEADYTAAHDQATKASEAAAALQFAAEAMPDPAADLAKLGEELQQSETINSQCRLVERAREMDKQWAVADAESKDLSAKIVAIDALKEKVLAGSKSPIVGLSYDPEAGCVTFNGRPLAQCSLSEKVKVGLAILITQNPQLRFVRMPETMIDGLDEDNLKWLDGYLKENNLKVIAERVLRAGESGLIIEEGKLDDAE